MTVLRIIIRRSRKGKEEGRKGSELNAKN